MLITASSTRLFRRGCPKYGFPSWHSGRQERIPYLSLLRAGSHQERTSPPFATCETILPFELQDYKLLFELADIYKDLEWRELQGRITAW
jgi:hypothetical protein